MKRKEILQTKTKAKISNKVAFTTIVLVGFISLGFVAINVLPVTGGSDDSKPSYDPPPRCPVGDSTNNGTLIYACVNEGEKGYENKNCSDTYVCDPGQKCCLIEPPDCPTGFSRWGEFCCNNETEDTVKIPPIVGKKVCVPKPNSCAQQGKKECPATKPTCCNKDAICGVATVFGASVAVCVPPNTSCAEPCGTIKGPDGEALPVCCGEGTRCEKPNGVPLCVPTGCDPGQELCAGLGQYKGVQKCCPTGHCAQYQPKGPDSLPFCK